MSGFQQYMENTLRKINEKKKIYLAGDFNTDFLKTDTNHSYKEFYTQLPAAGFSLKLSNPQK